MFMFRGEANVYYYYYYHTPIHYLVLRRQVFFFLFIHSSTISSSRKNNAFKRVHYVYSIVNRLEKSNTRTHLKKGRFRWFIVCFRMQRDTPLPRPTQAYNKRRIIILFPTRQAYFLRTPIEYVRTFKHPMRILMLWTTPYYRPYIILYSWRCT